MSGRSARLTKRQSDRFRQVMLAWTEDRASDAATLAWLLGLYIEVTRTRLPSASAPVVQRASAVR